MDDKDFRSTKYYSTLQENRVAKYLNYGVVSGSGSRACNPGDLVGVHCLCECKTHKTPGHRILFNWQVWIKLKHEAEARFKFPVLIVDDGSQRLDKTWCLFPSFIAPSYTKSGSYNFTINTNITFDGDDAAKAYSKLFYDCVDTFGVFLIDLNGDQLCVCPLPEFNRVFGDHE